jgi:pyruvate/2-oxoglutarate dehydrogenase complex dihydrolipoamide acyltransferase (E2) component
MDCGFPKEREGKLVHQDETISKKVMFVCEYTYHRVASYNLEPLAGRNNSDLKGRIMKKMIRFIPLAAALVVTQICMAQAPAGAPAGATALCNDGTYFMGATKQGGCRGHKGIKTWFGAAAAAPAAAPAAKAAPAPVATPAAAPAPAASPAASTAASKAKVSPSSLPQAPGGGPGLVWVNTASNVYHCSGSEWYGKTKAGSYMSEDQAKAKGAHPDHGKPCK